MHKCQQLKISITFIDLQVNLDTIPVINFVVTSIGTVLLKQKNQTVLDITGFFFSMSTPVKAEVQILLFQ